MKIEWKKIKLPLILASLSIGVVSFCLPIYSNTLGLSASEIGGLFSIIPLITLLMQPLIGRCVDKAGWKWFLVAAMIIKATSLYLLATAGSSWDLYIVRILQGISLAFLGVSTYNMAISISNENKLGKQLGAIESATSSGFLVGSVVGFYILMGSDFLSSWRRLFMLFALMASIGALLIAVRVKQLPRDRIQKTKVKIKVKLS